MAAHVMDSRRYAFIFVPPGPDSVSSSDASVPPRAMCSRQAAHCTWCTFFIALGVKHVDADVGACGISPAVYDGRVLHTMHLIHLQT